jgi:quercetin dioxygenase-like cupin family protein
MSIVKWDFYWSSRPVFGRMAGVMSNYVITQLDDLKAVSCSCGLTRRALGAESLAAFSLHLVEIQQDARAHYHKGLTEVYLVLEGTGQIELDGQLHPVKPYSAVLIRPGCRHRAIGRMKIANFVMPAFDPRDEWY